MNIEVQFPSDLRGWRCFQRVHVLIKSMDSTLSCPLKTPCCDNVPKLFLAVPTLPFWGCDAGCGTGCEDDLDESSFIVC